MNTEQNTHLTTDTPLYLDNAATTQVSPLVAKAMVGVMQETFGNPSSLHSMGIEAELLLTGARESVAEALGCTSEEIVFTSGGTEANNLALLGGIAARKRFGNKIITTQVEHSSVREPLQQLEQQGYQLVILPPLADGSLDLDALEQAVDENTVLVSAMLVNSELGSISDISTAVNRVKRKNKNTLFHTDAVQGFGKIPFTLRELGVDLASVSGHKIHASKGVGALYIKKGVRVVPRVFGGEQERSIRSGTEPLPQIVGFGLAAQEAQTELPANLARMKTLREYFVNKLKSLPETCINSTPQGSPYIQNLSLVGYRSEIVLHYLAQRNIYLSSGSACARGKRSHVLSALNFSPSRIDSALRVSFQEQNTTQDVDRLVAALAAAQQDILRSH